MRKLRHREVKKLSVGCTTSRAAIQITQPDPRAWLLTFMPYYIASTLLLVKAAEQQQRDWEVGVGEGGHLSAQ